MTAFPFWSLSGDLRELGLVVGVLIGFGFGFVLERAGFGRAQKLAAQFYGSDMTVFKVMFSAIVTAMLGTVVLSGLGLLDLRAVEFNYPTFLWPMIAGGLLLGVGFIVSGVVVMIVASLFVQRSKPFFARKMETVETMVPYDDPDDVSEAARASVAQG